MSNTILITGANRGIGLAFVQSYRERGDRVIAVCRNSSNELAATGVEIIDGIDLSSPSAGQVLLKTLGDTKINLLINNAGILVGDKLTQISYNSVLEQFSVNALAPLILTQALLGNLAEGAKVALITSRMGSMADNTSGGYYGYRMSKAALNMAGVSLALDLKPRGIAVAILHPGYVQTAMVNFGGDISAEVAASRLSKRIDALTLETSGSFWHSSGELLPW
jgi:NAD(P)-dependent dehydrogenase (short-subunit alcohol dehydrogenase family)